jgi:hypothetical protein
MPDTFNAEFAKARAEVEAALSSMLVERSSLIAAVAEAKAEYEARNAAFRELESRITRATHHGNDTVMPVIARFLNTARRARDDAAGALRRAELMLENADYRIGSLRGDLVQLELIVNPPVASPPASRIVKRPDPPFADGNFETIEGAAA